MKLNVSVANGSADQPVQLLVVPVGPEPSVPQHLQNIPWRDFATNADSSDALLGADTEKVRRDLERVDYALLHPSMDDLNP
jgi:hypothetical protein